MRYLLALLFFPATAFAARVSLGFEGTITDIESATAIPISAGDIVTGSLSYDPDTAVGADGSFSFTHSPLLQADLCVYLHDADRTIQVWHDHSTSSFNLSIADGSLTAEATAPFFPAGLPVVSSRSTLQMESPDSPLTSDALPSSLAGSWLGTWTYTAAGCVVHAAVGSQPVPEPAALLLTSSALALWGLRSRSRACSC